MWDKVLDFRSDTVTRPTAAMRAAMASAEVGDDVFGDDPSVNRLQEVVARRLGKEAAVFVASGTMSNLIAVRLHCKPGDELICEAGCHIYNYEQSGYAQINGIAVQPVRGELRSAQARAIGRFNPTGKHPLRAHPAGNHRKYP